MPVRPTKQQVVLASGAAAAFFLVGILNAVETLITRQRWHLWTALGFALIAFLWCAIAVRWKRTAGPLG